MSRRKDLKQLATILNGDAQDTAYKLTTVLNMALPPITGKTAAIEQECPLFGGTGPIEQQGLFAEQEEQ